MNLDFSDLDDIGALIRGDASRAIRSVPVADIDPDPEQPRRTFDPTSLRELADSMQQHGLLHPITVRPAGQRFVLISGERRWRAAVLLGLRVIEAIVRTDFNTRMQLIENIQREDLAPVEIARWIAIELEAGALQKELARELGKSPAWVSAFGAVRLMPRELQEIFAEGRVGDVTALAHLHALHREAPAVALALMTSSAVITRKEIDAALVGIRREPAAIDESIRSTEQRAAVLERSRTNAPSAAERERPRSIKKSGHNKVPAHTYAGNSMQSDEVILYVEYQRQPFQVIYREQRTVEGEIEVLLQSEDGQYCYGRLTDLILKAIRYDAR